MKTFFLALILGIFLGSLITNYFSDPDAYADLKEAKAKLFKREVPVKTEVEVLESVEPAPAMFEVGSAELATENADKNEAPESSPIPLPKPESSKEEPAKTEVTETTVEGTPEASPTPTPEPATPTPAPIPAPEEAEVEKSKTDQLIEEGAEKAEEIVEIVAEKAKEVAEDAKPIIEEGIDLTIAAGVRAQYKLERRINSDSIEISVTDNIVTLSGTVDSEETKQLAIQIAAFTKGVDGVEETLSIAE